MHHLCVCAHLHAYTHNLLLWKGIQPSEPFFHCLCSSYLDFKLGKRGRKMGGERVPPLSLFNLTKRGGESCSQLPSPEQGLGGTLTVYAVLHLQRAGPCSACGWNWAQEGQVCPLSPSLSRLISHYSLLYNVIAAQICSSKL